jgi:hypothetical protein
MLTSVSHMPRTYVAPVSSRSAALRARRRLMRNPAAFVTW